MQCLNGSMQATIRSLYRYMLCMSTCNYLWDGTWQSSLLRRVECILTCWVSSTRDAVALCASAQMRYVNLDHVEAPGDWNRGAWKKAIWILTNPRCKVAMLRIENAPLPLLGDTGCFCGVTSIPFEPLEVSYLVDPASSHMLVSKIKPCMSKYKRFYTVKLRMAH